MRVYIIINGSNDLYKPLKDSVDILLKNFKNYDDLEIILAFSLVDVKNIDIHSEIESSYLGYYKLSDKKVEKLEYDFKSIETSLNVEKFLDASFDKDYKGKNVLIISGHGGPFQSLLDMSISPAKSKNTFELCRTIKMYKFNLVFLDMCAMNYIEVIYELINCNNIESVLTYKTLAPFKSLDYLKFLDNINKKTVQFSILNSTLPFIYFDKESLILIEYIINIKNIIVKKAYNKINIDKEVKKILKYTSIVGEEAMGTMSVNADNLNFIKYKLEDDIDRKIYLDYLYSNVCNWRNIAIDEEKIINEECSYIKLDKESIKNIISMHNPSFSNKEIDEAFNTYISMRREEEFY